MARGNALEYELAMSEKAQDIHSALDRLEALGDYGDAAAQADECRYEIAKTAMNAGELQDALDAFEALGDVQDAPEQAQRCRYLLAQQAMSAGEYDEAIALYEACGAYLDAEDGAMQARYAKAAALFDAQEYEEAAKAFAELGSYEDAKQRVTDSEDAWLSADYNSARMDTELGNYAAVIDELAAYYESELPSRYAQMHDMYESACLARAQELTALGKPLDALPILKRIEGNKTAKKRMEAYVYQLIGRWKDTRGTEYVFREDGSCCIAGKEGYFGGSGRRAVSDEGRIQRGQRAGKDRHAARPAKRPNDPPELSRRADGQGRRRRSSGKLKGKASGQSINHHEKERHHHHCRRAGGSAGALWRIADRRGKGSIDRRGDGGRAGGAPPPAGHVGHL